MAIYRINTSNTNFLTVGEELVYAGKNGFTTTLGSIPVFCNSYVANASSIVFNTYNLHLLQDDNYATHVLDVPALEGIATTYVKTPILQYTASTIQEGSVGHTEQDSTISLDIQTYDITANTITVSNKPYGEASFISSILPTPPFYITAYQTLTSNNFSNRTAYISGSTRSIKRTNNVEGVTGTYTSNLGILPRSRNTIKVYLDDTQTDSFDLINDNVNVSLNGTTSEVKTVVDLYTVPAIEAKDLVSLTVFNNLYSVTNTSYVTNDSMYSADLTNSNFYKIKFNKEFSANVGGVYLLNVSPDLTGTVGNLTSTSFTVDTSSSYPYSYNLSNSNIYYLYQKSKVRYTTARLDEFGRLQGTQPATYIVEATNINRYNRSSNSIRKVIEVEPLSVSKVPSVTITESIIIDTAGGAAINITATFPTIVGRDVTSYEIKYRVTSAEGEVLPGGIASIPHDESLENISYTINGLPRGRTAGGNTLEITITPMIGLFRGFNTRITHFIIGKQGTPSGIQNLNVAQQGVFLLFSWQFQLTTEGYILDLDTKEVEIRQYPGLVDITSPESIAAAWGFSIVVARVAFPNTSYTLPISSFGPYTYLLRVRDTSDIESADIAASAISTVRPSTIRVIKSYNESDPTTSYITQDNTPFPTSNDYPELSFTSFSESINGGLVLSDSSNTDNANGSATGFSLYGNTNYLTTSTNPFAEYITPIRNMGEVVRGTIRMSPIIAASTPGITYGTFFTTVVSGITDFHGSAGLSPSANVLVDNAFGGIGSILGFNNVQAAPVTYSSVQKTLVSGGNLGNIYAIRNVGQFTGDASNANSFALIAGVINANAIALGEVYFANGRPSGSNSFGNVTISGNSYALINLLQYGDPESTITFLGEERSILQNVFVRYSTSNVYYAANANGVVGYPGHGNVNGNTFTGAANNVEFGWKNYVPGATDFQYFQVKIQLINPDPEQAELILQDLKYEVDTEQKTIRQKLQITSVAGVVFDYSYANFYEIPEVSAIVVDSATSQFAQIYDVTKTSCTIKALSSQTGNFSDNATISLMAVGG
jgi:hypothetical protein